MFNLSGRKSWNWRNDRTADDLQLAEKIMNFLSSEGVRPVDSRIAVLMVASVVCRRDGEVIVSRK